MDQKENFPCVNNLMPDAKFVEISSINNIIFSKMTTVEGCLPGSVD